MSFRDLKQNKKETLEKLSAKIAKITSNGGDFEADARFWYPEVDKFGNGFAVIRFLPAPEGEDSPTVKVFYRSFQGPTGKWYIENDLSTIGQKDPVHELNEKLRGNVAWDNIPGDLKAIISKQKRKTSFIANIYVVKDPAKPENEGKVFLYKFGVKIQEKINSKMNPSEAEIAAGDERLNPYDFWDGANFRLKIRKQDGFRNYEQSVFESPSPLLGGDDEALEAIYKSQYSLQDFLKPEQFKSREELELKLASVVGNLGVTSAKAPVEVQTSKAEKEAVAPWEGDDEIDDQFFEKMGEEEDAA